MSPQQKEFIQTINKKLLELGSDCLTYDESEFWMYQDPYEYIEFYAIEHCMYNTSIALPLARALHNGSHRKSSIVRDGQSYRLPYYIHCLLVCRMLVDLNLPLEKEELDITLAASLCHDMIEDLPFAKKGRELYEDYGLDERIYTMVKTVSKRKDFTEEEEFAFFHGIESNPLTLLIKLADRGNNVEDLYNMKPWKIHEYIGETRKFFIPMSDYGLIHYPELVPTIHVLRDKILQLTDAAEILVIRHEERTKKLEEQVQILRKEKEALRKEWKELFGGINDVNS